MRLLCIPICATVLLFAALGVTSGTAGAQSDWDASAYKGFEVNSVDVEGVDKKLAGILRKGLALTHRSGVLRKRGATFYPQTLDDDIARALLFMTRRGYPYATVHAALDGNAKRQTVSVTFVVAPGPPVRVAAVEMTGVPKDLTKKALDLVELAADSVFVDAATKKSVDAVSDLLFVQGYARATARSRVVWHDTTRVVLHIDVQAGNQYYFRNLGVTGAPDDLVALVRRTVTIKTGQRFSPRKVEGSEENLRLLGIFRQIRMDVVDVAADSVDVVTEVIVREPRTIDAALRLWTDEGLHGSVIWWHRNLFSGGKGGSLGAQSSTFLQEIVATAWWPSIFWPRSRGTVTVGAQREDEDNYTLEGAGVGVGLRWNYSLATIFNATVNVSNIDIEEKLLGDFDGATGLLTEFFVSFERKATDDWITPRSGYITFFGVEYAPAGVLSDNSYVRFLPSLAVFFPLFRTSGFAVRTLVGYGEPLGDSKEIIANKRFYAGGANSMRGFDRRKLGPLDPNGNEIGGEVKLETSLELRYPLFWRFRTTTFTDIGQVWLTFDDIDSDIEVAVGQGLWLTTPVGPLRGDIAYRLTDFSKTQPRWQFHFSIGPAF